MFLGRRVPLQTYACRAHSDRREVLRGTTGNYIQTHTKVVGTAGATGALDPRSAKTAEAKVPFRPLNAKFISWLHIVLYRRTAGELIRRTQNAPKLFAAGASPWGE